MPAVRFMTFQQRGERQKLIAEAYASGIPSERVAEMFGISGGHVRSIARLYEIARPRGRPRRDRLTTRATGR